MNKWVVGMIAFVVIAILAYLVDKGVLDWQPLTMLFAVLAAPFKLLFGGGNRIQEIQDSHTKKREQEAAFQQDLESRIAERGQHVDTLRSRIAQIDAKLEELESRRLAVAARVNTMPLDRLDALMREEMRDP